MISDIYSSILSLQHFHFIRPWWLLLIVPLYIILSTIYRRDDSLAVWRGLMSEQILSNLTVKGNNTGWFSPQKTTWVMSILIVILLAGPTWKQQPSPFTQDKSALVIALDVSETMEQSDVQPTRLIRAKKKILDLLALRGDSNTALIAYAGSAHIVMPVTNDREMISHFLDVLDRTLIPVEGKIPQNILPLAESLLSPTGVPGSVLMIGDGATEETETAFKEYFQNGQHQLVVWAIGDAAQVEEQEQNSVVVPMQLDKLESLASSSDGRLVVMTHDQQDVERVDHFLENNLVLLDDETNPWYDAGYPLVFIISLMYLLWFRRGWTLQW